MKKIILNTYVFIVLFLYFYSLCLEINGYTIFSLLILIFHPIILIKYQKEIKYKKIGLILAFGIFSFSKDIMQFIFIVEHSFILCIIRFKDKNAFKLFFLYLISLILLPIVILISFISSSLMIYENTHYKCENSYEIYSYSLGAMDRYHYSISKHYEILHINGILTISFKQRKEKTKEEYEKFLNEHTCVLVGD